jgi:hypothetical protein
VWLPLEILAVGLAVALALTGVALAVARRPRPAWYRPALQGLEAVLVVQAAVAGLLLLRGHRPEELITFVAYAVTSLVVVPVLLALLSSPDEEYGGPVWPNVLVAVAGAAVAVIVLRMGATWPGSSG